MAVAKKDQVRVRYAWMYGVQARKDGKERVVPEYWTETAEAWLRGFDGVLGAETSKPSWKPNWTRAQLQAGTLSICQAANASSLSVKGVFCSP